MTSANATVALLENALPATGSWFDIYSRVHEGVPPGEERTHRATVWAFAFDLIAPEDSERREREGSPFGAMLEFETGRLPPRLADVPDDDVHAWATLFEAVTDARAQSRLGDLLWERRHGPRPDQKARAACLALIDLAGDPDWEDMEATDGLVRALELALMLRDEDLRGTVVDATLKMIENELDSDADRPGIPFTLLTPLIRLPAADRPASLESLLRHAERKYGEDPHHFQTALDLQAALTPGEDAPALRARQVEKWRNTAADAHGILRMTWLEQALDLARTHGLKEQADAIRVDLGSITDEDLDLKEVAVEATVATEKVNDFVEAFVRFDDWRDSLARFGFHGPPGGEPEVIDHRVAERRKSSPLEFVATTIVVDPDSSQTTLRATDDVAREKVAAARERMLAARIWSVLGVDVLRRFEKKYGRPNHVELAAFFTTPFIDSDTADRVARACELWWEGYPDESAHLLAPRLETIMREIARLLGLPIISEPADGRPGRTRPLGTLFRSLEGRMPTEGWREYLCFLLADPLGLNLRNVVAHGLRASVSVDDAVLLIHAACFLRLVEPQATPPEN